MATQMQLDVILAGNRIAPAPCKADTTKESIKSKTKSGNCFCIRIVQSIKFFFRLIVMSTNLEYRARERQKKKEKIGRRPGKLNEKKGDRDLEREIKSKGDIFCWKKNMKIL